MHSTGCSAVLVDSAISHLHVDILRKDPVTGVTPTVVLRPPVSSDATRDGLERARSFMEHSADIAPADLRKEAEGGAFFLHTSGSTGEYLFSRFLTSLRRPELPSRALRAPLPMFL